MGTKNDDDRHRSFFGSFDQILRRFLWNLNMGGGWNFFGRDNWIILFVLGTGRWAKKLVWACLITRVMGGIGWWRPTGLVRPIVLGAAWKRAATVIENLIYSNFFKFFFLIRIIKITKEGSRASPQMNTSHGQQHGVPSSYCVVSYWSH